MKIILEASHFVFTEYGSYKLKYELLEYQSGEEGNQGVYYGIRICQIEGKGKTVFDICQVRGITRKRETAEILFRRMVDGLVMPVSLPDLIEDWQSPLPML